MPRTSSSDHDQVHRAPGCPGIPLRHLAGLTALLVFGLLAPTPMVVAAPTLSGLVRIEGEVPTSVSFEKELQLDCPPGKVAVSGGASLGGGAGSGQVLYQSLPVFDPPTSWSLKGRDIDGGGTSWPLRASLWCTDPPPGLERLADLSAIDSSSPKVLVLECPAGKTIVGGGAAIASSAAITVGLNALTPQPDESWRASGIEVFEDGATWALLAAVLCADVEPSLRFQTLNFGVSPYASAEVHCPDGYLPVAGGGEASGGQMALTGNRVGTMGEPFWSVTAAEPGSGGTFFNLDITVLCHSTLIFADDFDAGTTNLWSNAFP